MEADPDVPFKQEDKSNRTTDPHKITYPTLNQFIKTTRQLLRAQQKYEIEMFEEMTSHKTIKEIQDLGCGLSNMMIVGVRQGFYGKTILTLIKSYHSEKNPIILPQECKLQVGDDVGIYHNNSMIASGTVYKRGGPKMKIAIRDQQHNNNFDFQGQICNVVLRWNEVTFKRYFSVLQELEEYTVYKKSPLVEKMFQDAYHAGQPKRPKTNKANEIQLNLPKMNSEQIEAIRLGLTEQVHLIHGPPGTGKTTTVCELIVQAVKRGQKVLACAPSNIAVDNMVENLNKRVNCVRIGNPARVIEKVLERCLDFLVASNTSVWKNQVKKLTATEKRLKKTTNKADKKQLYLEMKQLQSEIHILQEQTIQEILTEADVICSTNVGAADRVFKRYLSKRKFDLVVIDECGQGLEISCWIPLLKGNRAILAGDHKQLPPTVKCQQNTLLSLTLFSRLMEQLPNTITSSMLRLQYRMNKLIMGWSNEMFYGNRLVADGSVEEHMLRELYGRVEQSEQVVMMVDTAGCKMGETGEENQSKMNVGEADLAVALYRKFIAYGVDAKHIALLTPYSKQVAQLKAQVLQQGLPNVDISTVDGIQGRQKECIIISMVRSNKNKQIGFLKDWRRMNVAVTRARRMLILIGNADCVSQDPYIGSLVKYIEKNGKVISALEFQEDPTVRFGLGVADEVDYNQKNEEKKSKKQKIVKQGGGKGTSSSLVGGEKDSSKTAKPSIYEAHTPQQIENLKNYYRNVFDGVRDEMVFPGATNFERKIIHEVASEMGLCHETSADKKQIKVWVRVQKTAEQIAEEEGMIKVQGKNKIRRWEEKKKQKKATTIEYAGNKKKVEGNNKFSSQIQNLVGDQSSDEEVVSEKEEKQQRQKGDEVKQKGTLVGAKVEEDVTKPEEKAKAQKKKKKKGQNKEAVLEEQEEDWEKMLDEFDKQKPKNDECFKCHKKISSVSSVKCRFCGICFCRSHVLAEEHGCDSAAKGQARSNQREVDKLIEKGAQKIKEKIKQQEEARKKGNKAADKKKRR